MTFNRNMRIFWLTTFAMVAFAANSVLTRYALALDQIGPGAFVAVRLMSGAVMLALLVGLRGGGFRGQGGLIPAAALLLYAAAFSYAYVSLDAGLVALILFGIVQITMFIGAIINGEKPRLRRWLGMLAGMLGLAVLFAPGAARPDITGAILMAAIIQLSVPIIALAGGMVFLDENIGITFVISTVLIVGGIALAVSAKR